MMLRNRLIVPWRDYVAAPSSNDPAKWQIATASDGLPAEVRPRLDPHVVPVYHGDHGGISNEWFVRHEVGVFEEGSGSHLFLGHVDHGWIMREGGPAPPPEP